MKTANIERKIGSIEESLKPLRIKGTTRIDWNCLTSQERALFDKVIELRKIRSV